MNSEKYVPVSSITYLLSTLFSTRRERFGDFKMWPQHTCWLLWRRFPSILPKKIMANDKIYMLWYEIKNKKKKWNISIIKVFFYCHCGFSLQRTETFHKVFDADDVEVIILECVSLFMATTTKLQKTNLERRKRRYTKKVRGSKIVQKHFSF